MLQHELDSMFEDRKEFTEKYMLLFRDHHVTVANTYLHSFLLKLVHESIVTDFTVEKINDNQSKISVTLLF